MTREAEVFQAVLEVARAGEHVSLGSLEPHLENFVQQRPESWKITTRSVLRALEASGILQRTGTGQLHLVLREGIPDAASGGDVGAKPSSAPPLTNGDGVRGTGFHDGIVGAAGSGGGGGDKNPPGAPPPSNGDNERGAGFREVLAHPYLLAMDPKQFAELVDRVGGSS